eukprot:gene2010-1201_t
METLADHNVVEVRVIDEKKGRGVFNARGTAVPAGAPLFYARPDITILYSAYGNQHCSFCFLAFEKKDTIKVKKNKRDKNTTTTTNAHPTVVAHYTCPNCDQFVVCEKCVTQVLLPEMRQTREEDDEVPLNACGATASLWYNELPASVRAPGMDTDYLRFTLVYGATVLLGHTDVKTHLLQLCDNKPSQSREVLKFCTTFARDKIVATFGNPALPSASPNTPRYPVAAEELTEILLRVRCNSFGFPFTPEATIGWSLHHLMCMVNHSCNPNAAVVFAELDPEFRALPTTAQDGTSSHTTTGVAECLIGSFGLKALRAIEPGEEITISYVDAYTYRNDVEVRTRALLETFRFLCTCDMCLLQRQQLREEASYDF